MRKEKVSESVEVNSNQEEEDEEEEGGGEEAEAGVNLEEELDDDEGEAEDEVDEEEEDDEISEGLLHVEMEEEEEMMVHNNVPRLVRVISYPTDPNEYERRGSQTLWCRNRLTRNMVLLVPFRSRPVLFKRKRMLFKSRAGGRLVYEVGEENEDVYAVGEEKALGNRHDNARAAKGRLVSQIISVVF